VGSRLDSPASLLHIALGTCNLLMLRMWRCLPDAGGISVRPPVYGPSDLSSSRSLPKRPRKSQRAYGDRLRFHARADDKARG
jgi:hypothetical protein